MGIRYAIADWAFSRSGFPEAQPSGRSDAVSGGKFPPVVSVRKKWAKSLGLPCDSLFFRGRGQGSPVSGRKFDNSRDRGEQVQGRYRLREVQSSISTTRFGSCIAGKIGDDGPSLAAPQFGANLPMGALDDGESDRSVSRRIRSTGPGSADIDSFLVS